MILQPPSFVTRFSGYKYKKKRLLNLTLICRNAPLRYVLEGLITSRMGSSQSDLSIINKYTIVYQPISSFNKQVVKLSLSLIAKNSKARSSIFNNVTYSCMKNVYLVSHSLVYHASDKNTNLHDFVYYMRHFKNQGPSVINKHVQTINQLVDSCDSIDNQNVILRCCYIL